MTQEILKNGATLIERKNGIVLAKRDQDIHPFVTWAEDADGNTYWGHYHGDLIEAVADFEERAS